MMTKEELIRGIEEAPVREGKMYLGKILKVEVQDYINKNVDSLNSQELIDLKIPINTIRSWQQLGRVKIFKSKKTRRNPVIEQDLIEKAEAVKQDIEDYRRNKEYKSQPYPVAIKDQLLQIFSIAKERNHSLLKICGLCGLNETAYNRINFSGKTGNKRQYAVSERNATPRKPKKDMYKVEDYDPDNLPEMNRRSDKRIEIIINHPELGRITVAGLSAKKIWNRIAGA